MHTFASILCYVDSVAFVLICVCWIALINLIDGHVVLMNCLHFIRG